MSELERKFPCPPIGWSITDSGALVPVDAREVERWSDAVDCLRHAYLAQLASRQKELAPR